MFPDGLQQSLKVYLRETPDRLPYFMSTLAIIISLWTMVGVIDWAGACVLPLEFAAI